MMNEATIVQRLAHFVANAAYDDLSPAAVAALKVRVLDSLACAFGALEGQPVRMLRGHLQEFDGSDQASLIGGGHAAPDRAALYNGALVRYLDYNDSYLAEGETCHPSDNLGAVLAAAEYAGADGETLLASLAAAYQVQCRLSDEAPVRAKGFDHTTQGSYAAAAGVARALGLGPERTAHALAISGTALNALRVTRTGELSHWKGLAYPHTAFGATHAALLAMRGITGPPAVFEGNKGFMDSIAGRFSIDWAAEDLERVTRTIVKKYNAEIHSQSATEGLLELQAEHGFDASEVEAIEVEIFDVAYHIIGGGEEGDKTIVRSKEEADHSLQYILAVALLDGQVLPAQYEPERIGSDDVQALLRRIEVAPKGEYSQRFPEQMPCRITVRLHGGGSYTIEKNDYEGFLTRPASLAMVRDKFDRLATPHVDQQRRQRIIEAVDQLEQLQVGEFMRLLDQGRA